MDVVELGIENAIQFNGALQSDTIFPDGNA